MSWRFGKLFSFGPLSTSLSPRGVGSRFGFFGFRFAVPADGRKYWSFGI